jgi:hypothetical protein
MKRFLLLLLIVSTIAAYAQPTKLITVNTVKPKLGQKMAFEAAFKVHISKFHKIDQKLSVWEVISGNYNGYYHLVNGGRTFADLDKDRPDATAHYLDLDKTFFPFLEETRNGTFRAMDSLSVHSDIEADKAIVNLRYIKLSLEGDYRQELARGIKVIKNLKGKFWENLSLNVFEQLWDGSDPVVVTIRNLKDGFQSLETDFYGATGTSFMDEYVKQFGTAAWDKRVKLLEEAILKNEQYIMKLRKDLSSQ